MPVTYHFKPFPKPGEPHFEVTQKRPDIGTNPCSCQKEKSRCSKCQQVKDENILRQPSQALLSPINEHPEQARPGLTPKAIRDRRRASSRASAASAFESAVGSDDYFTLFPSRCSRSFARSGSSSPTRSRSNRSQSSTNSSSSRSASSDQAYSPLAKGVESLSVQNDASQEKAVARRGS
ncbi:hypothetical protein Q7P37_005986 [Cladosporium fusiforme]